MHNICSKLEWWERSEVSCSERSELWSWERSELETWELYTIYNYAPGVNRVNEEIKKIVLDKKFREMETNLMSWAGIRNWHSPDEVRAWSENDNNE